MQLRSGGYAPRLVVLLVVALVAVLAILFGLSESGYDQRRDLAVSVSEVRDRQLQASHLLLALTQAESALRGYLFDTTEPLYPFGFGLSYTTFEIGAPRLSAESISRDGTANVTVAVTNTGARAGDEVVQLYIRDRVSSVTRPVKELRGFERVTLQPGETTEVEFTLDHEDLRFWNKDMKRVVEPGEFEIQVGSNSRDVKSTVLTVRQ
ncbi:MAG: hypothetical protein HC868_10145 [Sphingomonadales bacterium]|nr:hypothetical protein [Sphingomonadales bacterium]